MEITIIGWYGTETIGDRAILAGIISLLSKSISNLSIRLGSLYPFYSERTLYEDSDFFMPYLKVNFIILQFLIQGIHYN